MSVVGFDFYFILKNSVTLSSKLISGQISQRGLLQIAFYEKKYFINIGFSLEEKQRSKQHRVLSVLQCYMVCSIV